MKKMLERIKNWQTTITGIVLAITIVLSSIGVFTPEQSTEVQEQATVIFNGVSAVIGAIAAVILIFKAKD
jgi:hypothetical protein